MVVTRQDTAELSVRVLTFAAIYSAIGLRDSDMNQRLGKAMMAGPTGWQALTRLRRDAHEPSASCWLHGPTCCFSTLG
jgi:hypothetical protein